MLRTADTDGQLALGKKYSGREFELEELASGEIMLRPVCFADDGLTKQLRASAFQIALVDQVILPSRAQRNSRAR